MRRDGLAAYALAIGAALVAIALRWSVDELVRGVQFITFFPAVILVAFFLGTRPALVTAILCGIAGWYLFVDPHYSFTIETSGDIVSLAAYLIISGAMALVIGALPAARSGERQAVAGLRESEERFRTAADMSPALIWMSDENADIVFANQRYRTFFGVETDAMLGDGWRSIVHPDDVEAFHAAFLEAFAKREPAHLEVRVLHPELGVRWLSCDGTPRYAGGSFQGYVGVNIDITEAQLAHMEREQREARLQSIVEQMPVGVIIARVPDGEVMIYNQAAERLLGHPVVGGDVETYGEYGGLNADGAPLAPADYPAARAVLTGETVEEEEITYRRGDGIITHLLVSARRIETAAGDSELVVCTFTDISERKRHEQHQRLLIDELNHRVKNMLAIVQSLAQQTLKSGRVDPAVGRDFEGRLLALSAAHDVLTTKGWEPASIGAIFANGLTALGLDAYRVSLVGPRVRVPAKTAVSLAMAFHELATNAIKYGSLSTPDGRVAIAWDVEDGRLLIEWRESGGPPVAEPSRRGFGSRLIERALASDLQGQAKLDFRPEGLVCTIRAPLPPQED